MLPFQVVDIAAGAYPAAINILLALMRRNATGTGAYLDISMTKNLFPLMFPSVVMAAGELEPCRAVRSGRAGRLATRSTALRTIVSWRWPR
jgi:crotonobetainyl-CoA:carnitine CoA-transferase CaiB-like acyl-CoA transferase